MNIAGNLQQKNPERGTQFGSVGDRVVFLPYASSLAHE